MSYKFQKNVTCPSCKEKYTGFPAISRRDNETQICPQCGTREALEDFADSKALEETKEVVGSMRAD